MKNIALELQLHEPAGENAEKTEKNASHHSRNDESDYKQSADASEGERCDLPILGMHCAACANRLEKALGKAVGVQEANVNFATQRATVHYDPQATTLPQLQEVVKKAGYEALLPATPS